MFKKLVEKATKKNIAGDGIHSVKAEDVKPRVAFHNGVPPEACSLAYDSVQHILAISTRNGVIKLFGKDNTQALLQSEDAGPSKFLQFMDNQAILFNVTAQNHIEVWNIDKKQLSHAHHFNEEITSFTVVQERFFIYIGDCHGNVTILRFDPSLQILVQMPYNIPFSESHGKSTEDGIDTAVIFTSPQPMAENKRLLIIFKYGLITLWGIQESKVIFAAGGITQHSPQEAKTVVSASWSCIRGSKVVVGYSNGDIFLWAIPVFSDSNIESPSKQRDLQASQNIPLHKLNLGYKMDKVPIVSLRWFAHDERSGHLYVNGFDDAGSSHSVQIMVLNENSQTRTIKLVLPLTEPCLAMETVSFFSNQSKRKQNTLVLLLRSGCLCLYENSEIEHYLAQCQSKSHPTLPKQLMVKMPFGDSRITAVQLHVAELSPMDENQVFLPNKYSSLFSMKDGNLQNSIQSTGISKAKNLFITGHYDGAVNFWDASCPLLSLIMSIKQQGNESHASTTAPVTSLHFDVDCHVLVSGDQSGSVSIFTFKKEQHRSDNIFSFLQGKLGDNYTMHTFKLKGGITSICADMDFRHLALGTDKGYVAVIQVEGTTILYQKQISSQLYSGISSLQFGICGQNGMVKEILLVGMEDSSIMAIEKVSEHTLSDNPVRTKKPSKALLMHILDASSDGVPTPDSQDMSKESSSKQQPLVLLCSEKAIRLYSLNHAVQGIKKVYYKKTLDRSCCYAAIIQGPSLDVGLILIFACGKMEIRSLPDLTVLHEVSLRGLICPTPKSSPNSNSTLFFSSNGELILVNGDQAILFFSVLFHRDVYRHLEHITKVYSEDPSQQEESPSIKNIPKEKKKGIFSTIVKDLKGNKTKYNQEDEVDRSTTTEDLSDVFSTANYLQSDDMKNSSVADNDEVELNIDDIDLEENKVKQKGLNFAGLNKRKIGKTLQALKGKLKSNIEERMNPDVSKVDKEKSKINTGENMNPAEPNVRAVDQIKQKYGYSTSGESNTAKIAESKLRENITKLKGIEQRTSKMQNNAETFSSMAKELLEAKQVRKSSS